MSKSFRLFSMILMIVMLFAMAAGCAPAAPAADTQTEAAAWWQITHVTLYSSHL